MGPLFSYQALAAFLWSRISTLQTHKHVISSQFETTQCL